MDVANEIPVDLHMSQGSHTLDAAAPIARSQQARLLPRGAHLRQLRHRQHLCHRHRSLPVHHPLHRHRRQLLSTPLRHCRPRRRVPPSFSVVRRSLVRPPRRAQQHRQLLPCLHLILLVFPPGLPPQRLAHLIVSLGLSLQRPFHHLRPPLLPILIALFLQRSVQHLALNIAIRLPWGLCRIRPSCFEPPRQSQWIEGGATWVTTRMRRTACGNTTR
mmetsp:Transcript_12583/g.27724  ORF Transcript_12583/g.27724 Transcript_12583/m.27724 type:complete len:217 (-) Transcript_12583:500-1150(-)